MSVNDANTDVVELCALLQCLGFSVKSLNTNDTNVSQDVGTRTVVINCQSSGLHVVLESPGLSCSCPATDQNSGMWQVSGVSGGKQLDKEFGCTLLGSLPKAHREKMTLELREMIRCIKQHNESVGEMVAKEVNKSASMIELNTPEKRLFQPKVVTSTMYRSLDTLTAAQVIGEQPLPAPGPLTKRLVENKNAKTMCERQNTFTLTSTPRGSVRRRNKTSSPIQNQQNTLLEHLIEAEKDALRLRNKLLFLIRNHSDEGRDDFSMSSLALDVSKISVVKAQPGRFASSPNLSESANEKPSRLHRFSSNIFKSDTGKPEKPKVPDSKGSKLNSLFRTKIAPVIRPPAPVDKSVNKSAIASKKKTSIPKPTPLKK